MCWETKSITIGSRNAFSIDGTSNGNYPNLHWICGKAEEASLNPSYALIVAGNSLHWMNWDELMPTMKPALSPTGTFAIVDRGNGPIPWGTMNRI